jgi:hypothetical protein
VDDNMATVRLCNRLNDGHAQPKAAMATGGRTIALLEALADPLNHLGIHPSTRIADGTGDGVVLKPDTHCDRSRSGCELEGILHQAEQRLLDLIGIAENLWCSWIDLEIKYQPGLGGGFTLSIHNALGHTPQGREEPNVVAHLSGKQDIDSVDEPPQLADVIGNDEYSVVLGRLQPTQTTVAEQLGVPLGNGQRRTQLVVHVPHERVR